MESPVYRLSILRPLALKKVEAAVEPPAYTRKPAAVVPEGNLAVLRVVHDQRPRALSGGEAKEIDRVASAQDLVDAGHHARR